MAKAKDETETDENVDAQADPSRMNIPAEIGPDGPTAEQLAELEPDAIKLLQAFINAANQPRYQRNGALHNIKMGATVEMRNITAMQDRIDAKIARQSGEDEAE